jgi:hypothetical protein
LNLYLTEEQHFIISWIHLSSKPILLIIFF